MLMDREYISCQSTNDVGLHLCKYSSSKVADEKYKYNILFLPDWFDHQGRYTNFYSYILEKFPYKLDIYGLDFYGQGASAGHRGHLPSFDNACQDVVQVINTKIFVDSSKHQQKLVYIGFGFGGLVILKVLEQYAHLLNVDVTGFIAINPLIRPNSIFKSFVMNLPQIKTLDKLRVNLNFKGEDILDSVEETTKFDADPLVCKFMTRYKLRSIFEGVQSVKNSSYFINCPNLFFVSDNSYFCKSDAINLFHKGLSTKDSRMLTFTSSHDILNSKKKTKAFEAISRWMMVKEEGV